MNCARARRRFPDAEVDAHVDACSACQAELSAFRAVLDAAADFAGDDVPDPGDAYWEQFLPSVRARLAARDSISRPRRRVTARAAAAVLLMLGAAAGAMMLPGPAGLSSSPVVEASMRLDKVLQDQPGLAPEIAADMLGTDPLLGLDAVQLLAALEETEPPAGLAGDWADESVRTIIEELSRSQRERLREELESEKG